MNDLERRLERAQGELNKARAQAAVVSTKQAELKAKINAKETEVKAAVAEANSAGAKVGELARKVKK